MNEDTAVNSKEELSPFRLDPKDKSRVIERDGSVRLASDSGYRVATDQRLQQTAQARAEQQAQFSRNKRNYERFAAQARAAAANLPCDMTPYEGQLHSDDLSGNEQVLPIDTPKTHNAGQDGPIVFNEPWQIPVVNVITRQVTADYETAKERVMRDVLKRQRAAKGLLI